MKKVEIPAREKVDFSGAKFSGGTEIVGHSDIEVTMTIYAHMSLEEKRKALGKLGEVLG
jgi:hypothetical protein